MTVAQHTPPPNPGIPHGQGVAQRHANRAHYSQNNDWAYNYHRRRIDFALWSLPAIDLGITQDLIE